MFSAVVSYPIEVAIMLEHLKHINNSLHVLPFFHSLQPLPDERKCLQILQVKVISH
jgi:hypothetical protein